MGRPNRNNKQNFVGFLLMSSNISVNFSCGIQAWREKWSNLAAREFYNFDRKMNTYHMGKVWPNCREILIENATLIPEKTMGVWFSFCEVQKLMKSDPPTTAGWDVFVFSQAPLYLTYMYLSTSFNLNYKNKIWSFILNQKRSTHF